MFTVIQVSNVQCIEDSLASDTLDSRAPICSQKHYFVWETRELIRKVACEKKENTNCYLLNYL